jgi:hypothetical protein
MAATLKAPVRRSPAKPANLVIPENGKPLGKFLPIGELTTMVNEVSANVCIARRSMAANVAGGKDFGPIEEPRQHLGDPEFYEGINLGAYPKELREALIGLSRNHCLRQLIRAGEIFDHLGKDSAAECRACAD